MHVDMTIADKRIEFDLDIDPHFVADICTDIFLKRNGSCEPEVVHLMRKVLREGDWAIDGGANIGFMTLVMSRLVGATGLVAAYEPMWANFDKLNKNLHLNGVFNVTRHKAALWSESAKLILYTGGDTGNCSIMPYVDAVSSVEVAAQTLDGSFSVPIRFLKLDVEGAEEHVLIGASKLLDAHKIDFVTCEINEPALARFGSSQMHVRKFMHVKGYSTFILSEDGALPEQVPPEALLSIPTLNTNILFSTPELVKETWNGYAV